MLAALFGLTVDVESQGYSGEKRENRRWVMNCIYSHALMWLAFAYTWDKRLVYEDLLRDGSESVWNALIHIIDFESDEIIAEVKQKYLKH